MKKLLSILILCFFATSMLFSQTETDKAALEQFSKEKTAAWQKATKRVDKYLREHNEERRREFEDGTIIELVDVVNGRPIYAITDNAEAAITTRANELWPGGSLGISVTGANFHDKIGVWDGGSARATHQEFNNTGVSRVLVKDGGSQSAHATHVAGTIIAAGVDPAAQGMAYEGTVHSYDWGNPESEMAAAASGGMLISNHSWGYITGWNYDNGWDWYGDPSISDMEDYNFGYYSDNARSWDVVAKNAPYFLIVKSAGNDRGDGPNNAGSPGVPEKDGGEDGFDCISYAGNAKNILTIGAAEKVLNYTKPEDVKIAYFSGWGPADDGRIKPDVVAAGVNLYSPVSSGDARYDSYSGTSMSTPNTTGTLSLVHEYYQSLYDEDMRSSTLKALIIHTADECGPDEGPDYMHGWGLVNAQRAAEVIQQHESLLTINEITLENGGEYTRNIATSGNEPLRITICWTDPAGPVYTPSLNNRAPVLVNDLDLKLVDANGNTFYPYKLDPDNPSNPATTDSTNDVDNVEHIYIGDPQGGNYTIVVNHKGNLQSSEQIFSLIVSGIGEYSDPPVCTAIESPEDGSSYATVNQEIIWKKADFATYYEIYFGTDGNGTSLPTNIYNGETFSTNFFQYDMEPATTYYLAIHPGNDYGTNTACNTVFSFTTCSVDEEELPYSIDLEHATAPAFPIGWQSIDNSDWEWKVTNEERYEGKYAIASMVDFGQIEPFDNMLISPPIEVKADRNYVLKFYHRVYQHINESMKVVWGTFPTADEMKHELFSSNEVQNTDWEELIIPIELAIDDYIYIGIHHHSPEGSGVLIDNILLEEAVGINEIGNDDLNVYYDKGYILFSGTDAQEKAEVSVFNMLGQEVLTTQVSSLTNGKIRFEAVSGIYIVHLKRENGVHISKKIVVR